VPGRIIDAEAFGSSRRASEVQVLIGLLISAPTNGAVRGRLLFVYFERNYRNADEALGNDARRWAIRGISPKLSRLFYKSELEMPMYLI
jgi:hypothetical protein